MAAESRGVEPHPPKDGPTTYQIASPPGAIYSPWAAANIIITQNIKLNKNTSIFNEDVFVGPLEADRISLPDKYLHNSILGKFVKNNKCNIIIANNKQNPETPQNIIKYTQIKDIKGGEMVMSLNEKTGKLEPRKIKGLMDMGFKEIYRLTTESGKTIRTTANHPYLKLGIVETAPVGRLWQNGEEKKIQNLKFEIGRNRPRPVLVEAGSGRGQSRR